MQNQNSKTRPYGGRATESVAILAKIALFCIFSAKNLDLSVNFAFLQKRDFQHKNTQL